MQTENIPHRRTDLKVLSMDRGGLSSSYTHRPGNENWIERACEPASTAPVMTSSAVRWGLDLSLARTWVNVQLHRTLGSQLKLRTSSYYNHWWKILATVCIMLVLTSTCQVKSLSQGKPMGLLSSTLFPPGNPQCMKAEPV